MLLLLNHVGFEAAGEGVICGACAAPRERTLRAKHVILLVGVALALERCVVDTALRVPRRHIVVVMHPVATEGAVILTADRLPPSCWLVGDPVRLALIVLLGVLAAIIAIMAVTIAIVATILSGAHALVEVVINHL